MMDERLNFKLDKLELENDIVTGVGTFNFYDFSLSRLKYQGHVKFLFESEDLLSIGVYEVESYIKRLLSTHKFFIGKSFDHYEYDRLKIEISGSTVRIYGEKLLNCLVGIEEEDE